MDQGIGSQKAAVEPEPDNLISDVIGDEVTGDYYHSGLGLGYVEEFHLEQETEDFVVLEREENDFDSPELDSSSAGGHSTENLIGDMSPLSR